MTVVMRDYHGHTEPLHNAAEASEWFDEQTTSIMPTGECGQTIWFGPADADPALRLDIDIDAARAALRWTDDGSHAVELDPDTPITVLTSADGATTVVSADLARLSPGTARAAVIEYVTTGQRPTIVDWHETHADRAP